MRPLLEVIALDVADARAAQEGGADRIELVRDMGRDGLTPDLATFEAVRAAVDLPIRTMLRQREGFGIGDPDRLRRTATALRGAGADEFVMGFLDSEGAVDVRAVHALLEVIDGCRWTFHRAIDHAADRAAVWRAIDGMPGLDFVLTSGAAGGMADGIGVLVADCAAAPLRILAGGGLARRHVQPLREAGVDAFHCGTAVRTDGRWDLPVDPARVKQWRAAIGPST